MSQLGIGPLLAGGVYLLGALACAIVLQLSWIYLRSGRRRGWLLGVFLALNWLGPAYFLPPMLIVLTPTELHGRLPCLHAVLLAWSNLAAVAMGPLYRHFITLLPVAGPRPGRRWLRVNYASAVPAALLAVSPLWLTRERWLGVTLLVHVYLLVMLVRGAGYARRLHERGRLPGTNQPDVEVGSMLMLCGWGAMLCGLVGASVDAGPRAQLVWLPLLRSGVWLSAQAPFLVRVLEQLFRRLVVAVGMVAAAALFFVMHTLTARIAEPETRFLLRLLAVWWIVVVLAPGHVYLRRLVDRVVLRRSRRRQDEILAAMHDLSPELGVAECCRRALAMVGRVMQLRGAAVMLGDETVAHGDFPVAALATAWPRGAADVLPAHSFGGRDIDDPALGHALMDHGVTLVVPIASRHRRWGHLLTIPGRVLGTLLSEEDVQTLEAFADQLALLLDGAELLARAVAVERSLAHAEKLAAIGELAARIAHEIRNPITAARSLAQQLCREAPAPLEEPARLILTELERVERQVASLLRFARREEFRFEPVDLGRLVRSTAAEFASRLDAAGVTLSLDSPDGIVARADREKLRQVLINLIENALDALAGAGGSRQLGVSVQQSNGSGIVHVTDSGPGVTPDALGRLFEPFFSLKPQGTGLGLAIAKRTVEAHGGTIAAARPGDGGMRFDVELPLSREP